MEWVDNGDAISTRLAGGFSTRETLTRNAYKEAIFMATKQSIFYTLALLLPMTAAAATPAAPKVAFAGDGFVYAWAQSPQFQANANWSSYATPEMGPYQSSATAALDFPSVIASRPGFVFIDTGFSDMGGQTFEFTAGHDWSTASNAITSMVTQAQAAGIKVILGNVALEATTTAPLGNFDSDLLNDWIAQYGASHNIPVVNLQYWLAHGCSGVMLSPCTLSTNAFGDLNPNAAGYAFIDILVQQAVAEYGLTIKGGYLSNVQTVNNPIDGTPPLPLAAGVNQECTGSAVQFTPWATYSDGVSREMLNTPFGGTLGTWRSDNPAVMGVNQHGMAYAYAPGKANIWFTSASGQVFSPWTMTVFSAYPGGN